MQVTINSNAAPYENLLTNLSLVPEELASCIDPETGSFLLNGEWISPGAVRELDEWTGAKHYQYATPGGAPQNANIWTIKPGGAVFLGSDGKAAEVQPAAPEWLPAMGVDWIPIGTADSIGAQAVDAAADSTETSAVVEAAKSTTVAAAAETAISAGATAIAQTSIEPEASVTFQSESASAIQLRLDLELAVLQQQASAGTGNTIPDPSLLEYL
jgi:hypothetical protein